MAKTAKEALGQIERKACLTELHHQGVREIRKYRIAFCGKRVWLEKG